MEYILTSKHVQCVLRLLTPGEGDDKQLPHQYRFRILVLAALYFVLSYVSLYLIIPQGYSSTIWPAAGLALAGLLIYGVHYWPAIMLGYLSAAFSLYLNGDDVPNVLFATLKTLLVATGPTLQAIVGSNLIKQRVDISRGLLETKQILWFFLLGGPVACLISASIGVSVLAISGDIVPADYAFSWITWWIGDTIGVLLISPLVLVWLGRPTAIWKQRRLRVALPLIITLAMMAVLFYLNVQQDRQRIQEKFDKQANAVSELITEQWQNDLRALNSVKRALEVFTNVSHNELHHYVDPLLTADSTIQAIVLAQYHPQQTPEIQHLHTLNNLAQEPFSIDQQTINSPHYLHATRLALQDNSPIGLTPTSPHLPDSTLSDHTAETAFVLPIIPISKPADGHDPLLAIAIIHADHLDKAIAAQLQIRHMTITLSDVTAQQQTLAHWRFDANGLTTSTRQPSLSHEHTLSSEQTFHFGNRTWKLTISAGDAYFSAQRSLKPWYILLVGYLFASSLGILLLILTGQTVINQRLAQTDLLTGLYNRRFIEQTAEQLELEGKSYTMLLLDLDHFKQINDNWGHQAGDYVLKTVARRILASLPKHAYAGRWGGEEFIILLMEKSPHKVILFAEYFRKAISQLPLENNIGQITVSIGCAFQRPGLTYHELIREADQALYRAKDNGRNRIEDNTQLNRQPTN